jgi:hypothetical protein
MRTVVFGGQGDPGFDPEFPSAYPVEGRVGLLGEVPVRLRAEGKALAAYGFGGQRIEIPARSIRQVWIHPEFEVISGGRKVPSLVDAENCLRLRVRPAGGPVTRVAAGLGQAVLCLGGGIGGALLGLLLPASAGDARILAAVGLGVAGALAGAWLGNFGWRFAAGVIGWAVASRRAGAPGISPDRGIDQDGGGRRRQPSTPPAVTVGRPSSPVRYRAKAECGLVTATTAADFQPASCARICTASG